MNGDTDTPDGLAGLRKAIDSATDRAVSVPSDLIDPAFRSEVRALVAGYLLADAAGTFDSLVRDCVYQALDARWWHPAAPGGSRGSGRS